MSLYYEAVDVIEAATTNGGSIKSIVFGRKDWKSNPKALFALATEAAKWSEILSEVIEKGGLLKIEKQVREMMYLEKMLADGLIRYVAYAYARATIDA